ncbi:GH32 C-terminal domain-containing protein, partial [Escherichia coli]|nr:GH32 C-terminal domain-containing protein [Escherichia coli]
PGSDFRRWVWITIAPFVTGYRSVELPDTEYLTLRIFLDRSSVEVFVNDGEATLSSRIYPQADSRQLSLYAAHGDAILTDGTLWMLT